MSSAGLFIGVGVVFLLACLGSVGHDIWYANEQGQDIYLAEIGAYFQLYLKDYYLDVRSSMDSESFILLQDLFLDVKAAYLTGSIAVIFFFIAFLMNLIFGEPSEKSSDGSDESFARDRYNQGKKMVYKRK